MEPHAVTCGRNSPAAFFLCIDWRSGQALRGANWKSLRLGEALGTLGRVCAKRAPLKNAVPRGGIAFSIASNQPARKGFSEVALGAAALQQRMPKRRDS